jgi:hypothetical protein
MQVLATTYPDPWAPDATCDRCGGRGTVARSRRTDIDGSLEMRYCAACWPEQRAEQVRQSVQGGARYSIVRHDRALTWERLVALATAVERVLPPGSDDVTWRRLPWAPPLNSVATELFYDARRLTGPMPEVVRSFIDRSVRGGLANR